MSVLPAAMSILLQPHNYFTIFIYQDYASTLE